MTKLISAALAGAAGVVLAVFAAWGVVSANTAAPSTNPVGNQVVDYGGR